MTPLDPRLPLALATLAALAAGCSKGPAYGSPNAVIAVIDPAIAERVEPILRAAIEREVVTTRTERIFELTVTAPGSLGEFRRWRRLIVVEPLADATLVPELADVPEGAGRVVARVEDRWARGQVIHVLGADGADATVRLVEQLADSLFDEIHAAYVAGQVDRMWASEADSAGFRSMTEELGFGIVLPRVYQPAPGSAPPDSRVWFNADPRRVVALHWTGLPAALAPDTVLALRRAWGAEVYPGETIPGGLAGDAAHDTAAAAADSAPAAAPAPPVEATRVELDGRPAIRLQGTWIDATDAGVFLTYAVACGERLVLLDGNLFAPDREKYPYVLQLDRIFSTFRCAAGA